MSNRQEVKGYVPSQTPQNPAVNLLSDPLAYRGGCTSVSVPRTTQACSCDVRQGAFRVRDLVATML